MRTTQEWADTIESYSEAARATRDAHHYASALLRHIHNCAVSHQDASFPNAHKVSDLQIVFAMGVAMANSTWNAASAAGAMLESMGEPTGALVECSVEDLQYMKSLEPRPFEDIVQGIKRDIGDVEEDYDCGVGLTVTAITVELDTASEHAEPQILNSADESARDGHERLRTDKYVRDGGERLRAGDIGVLETRESGYERAVQHALADLDRFNQSSQPHHDGVCPVRATPQ